MAKGKKTGGADFQPGQSGNPGGRPAIPADIKEARKLTQIEFEKLVNKYIWLTQAGFGEAAEDQSISMFERMIGSIVQKACNEGDHQRLNFLLDRLIGKVTEKMEIKAEPFIVKRKDGTEIVMGAAAKKDKA